ncbi:MAG: NADH:flavin oxidoreductase [Halobacteriovoraceae bacterium]|nr:NADH:flavin oxidoreductase [Halobacteriovoraceae bacterium]
MSSNEDILAKPLSLPCGAVIQNRLCKSAMTEGIADEYNRATDEHLHLYKSWSEGGAGLLISGNIQVDRRYLERPGNIAIDGNQDEEQLRRLRNLAEAGTKNGNHFWVQLSHAGRQTDPKVNKFGVGPSAIKSRNIAGQKISPSFTPRELDSKEISNIIHKFSDASRVLKETGFTGVQIHSAHGYLLSSFLNPNANKRDDEYGGTIQNRASFLIHTIRSVRKAVGKDFPVSIKINVTDCVKGGLPPEEAIELGHLLDQEGLDLIEMSGGNYESIAILDGSSKAHGDKVKEAYFLETSKSLREKITKTPLMLTGGLRSRSIMERIVNSESIDMIGIGRPLCGLPSGPKLLLEKKISSLPRYEDKIDFPLFLKWIKIFSIGKVLSRATTLFWCYYNEILLSKGEKSDEDGTRVKGLKAYNFMDKFDLKKASSLKGLNECEGLILNRKKK